MKCLIVYSSVHHMNTEKVAKVMAEELGATLLKTAEAKPEDVGKYDLVGFGSGIYVWKHHQQILDFADKLPTVKGKNAFIFSTSGQGGTEQHKTLREKLAKKGYEIAGEFACKGYDTVWLLRLVGGMNRGKPDEQDLLDAKAFAKGLKKG